MQEINDILNWSFIPSNLSGNAERIINSETKRHIKNSIQRINEISDHSLTGLPSDDYNLLKDIHLLFINNKHRNYNELVELFSKRDTKLLVWSLDYHSETGELPILFTEDLILALRIISDRWRDSFIISIWHTFLKNWDSLHEYKKERKIFLQFLNEKIKDFKGSRKDITNFNSNASLLLSKTSPSDYARKMLSKGISIKNANQLINQKDRILFYEYFSDVVLSYVSNLDQSNIDDETLNDIYEFVDKQNLFKTKLLTCSKIINSAKFNNFQKIIKFNTINLIGDPIRKDKWMSSKLSIYQEESVEKARMKFNMMLNQQFIKVFFEKLVQDNRRKKYWLKFVDKIDNIKFVGNRSNYHYLKNIENISKYVDTRYKTTSGNQSTCALVIYSQNFVFVEFTDTGALYIYKQNNFTVNLNAVNSMADLKIWPTSLWACKNSSESGYVDLQEEGRITHQGNWEIRFNAWMKKYYKKSKPPKSKVKKRKKQSNNSIIRNSRYNTTDQNAVWESKLLYWSNKKKPGYIYSSKKEAWWKKK